MCLELFTLSHIFQNAIQIYLLKVVSIFNKNSKRASCYQSAWARNRISVHRLNETLAAHVHLRAHLMCSHTAASHYMGWPETANVSTGGRGGRTADRGRGGRKNCLELCLMQLLPRYDAANDYGRTHGSSFPLNAFSPIMFSFISLSLPAVSSCSFSPFCLPFCFTRSLPAPSLAYSRFPAGSKTNSNRTSTAELMEDKTEAGSIVPRLCLHFVREHLQKKAPQINLVRPSAHV